MGFIRRLRAPSYPAASHTASHTAVLVECMPGEVIFDLPPEKQPDCQWVSLDLCQLCCWSESEDRKRVGIEK